MKLRIGVGVSEEWVEQALPILMRAGFTLVAQSAAPGSDGEYVECDFDYRRETPITVEVFNEVLAEVRRALDASLVPRVDIRLV